MNNKWRKILALVLSLIMILALIPATVSADAQDNGNDETPELVPAEEIPAEEAPAGEVDMLEVKEHAKSVGKETFRSEFSGEEIAVEKDPEADSASALNCPEPDPDKDVCSAALTSPAGEKEVEETIEGSETRGNIYNGTMYLGKNYFTISNGGDVRYMYFTAPTTGKYRFYTVQNEDTKGFLQDSSKTELTFNDDGGYNYNFMIEYTMTAGSNYYLGAKFLSASTTGDIIVYADLVKDASDMGADSASWAFTVSTAGQTVYRKYVAPSTGTYTIYSISDQDTIGGIADNAKTVFMVDDDGGYNSNFCFDVDLTAGETYYILTHYFVHDTTGTIRVFVEQRTIGSNDVQLGRNTYNIDTAGTTVYRKFTAPYGGTYWIYSVPEFGGSVLPDTCVYIANSDKEVYQYNDDGGSGTCFRIVLTGVSQGDVIYIGAKFRTASNTGYIPVFVDYYYSSSSDLSLGRCTTSISKEGSMRYRPFTPTTDGTYTFYSYEEGADTIGILFNSDKQAILFDDDSGYGDNFKLSYNLTGGTTYYFGVEYYDFDKTGDITFMVEKQDVHSELSLGRNNMSINTGETEYFYFTAPYNGIYWIYSVDNYASSTVVDPCAVLADSDNRVYRYDDSSGYGNNFRFVISNVSAGDVIWFGVRLFDSTASGNVNVFIDYPKGSGEVVQGLADTQIEMERATYYYAFTPTVDGIYTIYSFGDSDTIGLLADSSYIQILFDDDSGYDHNFKYSYNMTAGTKYYIGVRYYGSATGTITLSIERQNVTTEELILGRNFVSIDNAGETLYRPFTAPYSGYYWIYTADLYGESTVDTLGILADDNVKAYDWDDHSGYLENYEIRVAHLDEGQKIYVGTRFYSATETGTVNLLIDYPYEDYNSMKVGANTFAIDQGGVIIYNAFTPTETATYRVYTSGSDDTLGVLRNANGEAEFFADDTSASNRNFRFDYDMTAGETYYIGAKFYDNTKTGDLIVRIKKMASTLPAFDGTIEWNPDDVEYKGSTPYVIANGNPQTPGFTVKDSNGSVVAPSNYTYEYLENTAAGTGYVRVTFTALYSGTAQKYFKIYLPATTTTTVANTNDGIKITWTAVEGADGYVIYRRAWNLVDAGWTDFVRWNNTTALTWTDTKVYAGTRYQYGIKAYFNKRLDPISGTEIGGNVGDNFNLGMVGPLKTTVRITTRELKSVTAGSKKLTAKWAGSSVFTGYQLQIATDSKFTANKQTFKITDPKTVQKVVTGLTSNTTYYVRVRSYHVFEGMTYYGGWSNVKNCKVK